MADAFLAPAVRPPLPVSYSTSRTSRGFGTAVRTMSQSLCRAGLGPPATTTESATMTEQLRLTPTELLLPAS